MIRYTLSFLALTILSAYTLQAQSNKDIFGVEMSHYSPSDLGDVPDVANLQDLQVDYDEVRIFGKLPLVNNDNFKFIITPQYDLKSFHYDQFQINGKNLRPYELHDIRLGLVMMKTINYHWSFTTMFTPGASSDFEESISSEDMLYRGAVMVNYKFGRDFKIGIGAMHSYVFGESQILPSLKVNYHSADQRFELDILLPRITTSYELNKFYTGGFEIASSGSQYNYKDITVDATTTTDYFKFSQTNIGPFLRYNSAGNLSLILKGGVTVNRTAQVFDSQNNELVDITPEDSKFIQLGVTYRMK